MKTTYKTNLSMAILAYAQKLIAIGIALFFGVMYLKPAIIKATGLNDIQAIVSIAIALIVFELILHFGLESFTKALVNRVVEVTNLLGVIFTFALIAVLGWFATDNLPYFRSDISQKTSLINIDSLRRVHGEIISKKEGEYDKKLSILDNAYLPQISSQTGWLLGQTQGIYNTSRSLLLSEKSQELELLEAKFKDELSHAQVINQNKINRIEKQDKSDAQSTAWFSIVILVFSLYSTVVIGIYKGQAKTKDTKQDTTVQSEVQSEVQSTMQSTTIENHNHITVLVSTEKKSEKRRLAESYLIEQNLLEKIAQKEMKDKEVFSMLQEKFSLSWGTYSQIKRELKNQ
jgi:TRAP-type C4-dicarboxylate transport system permease small subunit